MPHTNLKRICAAEYGVPLKIEDTAKSIDLPGHKLRELLYSAAGKLKDSLGITEPILFQEHTFQVVDCAGLLRLQHGIELEIRPKCLDGNADWTEDFFCIATLVKFGKILPHDALASKPTGDSSVADLIARAMVSMFDSNRRRPLRAYRRDRWQDFFIDGEVNDEDLVQPDEDGFWQSGMLLDNQNEFNRCIREAMQLVLPEVRDGDLRRILALRVLSLSPQSKRACRRHHAIPARHKRWRDLYELSRLVQMGFGIRYEIEGARVLPGFVLRTADAWEQLLRLGITLGLKGYRVRKNTHLFGKQCRVGAPENALEVEPDLSIYQQGCCVLVADAKYKGRASNSASPAPMSRADIYEALAFLRAVNCRNALLFYPSLKQLSSLPTPGSCAIFERICVNGYEVIGVAVDVHGIAKNGGLFEFSSRLSEGIRSWCDQQKDIPSTAPSASKIVPAL